MKNPQLRFLRSVSSMSRLPPTNLNLCWLSFLLREYSLLLSVPRPATPTRAKPPESKCAIWRPPPPSPPARNRNRPGKDDRSPQADSRVSGIPPAPAPHSNARPEQLGGRRCRRASSLQTAGNPFGRNPELPSRPCFGTETANIDLCPLAAKGVPTQLRAPGLHAVGAGSRNRRVSIGMALMHERGNNR